MNLDSYSRHADGQAGKSKSGKMSNWQDKNRAIQDRSR